MAYETPEIRGDSVHGFLIDHRDWGDRRLRGDRRVGDRRTLDRPPFGVDPRTLPDRRAPAERRAAPHDRRDHLGDSFTTVESAQICALLMDPAPRAACPRCDGPLLVGLPGFHGDDRARQVHCTTCRHQTVILHLPRNPPALNR